MLRPSAVLVVVFTLVPSTVHALDHHDHHLSSHHGSSGGGGCSGEHGTASSPGEDATVTSPAPSPSPPSTASGQELRVFVTSELHAGDLGGIAGADARCQAAASAQGFDGVYRAWLSDSTTTASERILSSGPWYTASGELAFATGGELAGPPRVAIVDETGGTAHAVWSGSDTRGQPTGMDCGDWTSAKSFDEATTGLDDGAYPTWGGGGLLGGCDAPRAVVCIAQ